MGTVDLPFLPYTSGLEVALQAMRKYQRSAVVTDAKEGLWLFRAGPVVQGLARNLKYLADLETRKRVYTASHEELLPLGIPLVETYPAWDRMREFMDEKARAYIVIIPSKSFLSLAPEPKGLIQLVSRHEELANLLRSGPTDCYCTDASRGSSPHEFSQPLPKDGLCPFDQSKIVCS